MKNKVIKGLLIVFSPVIVVLLLAFGIIFVPFFVVYCLVQNGRLSKRIKAELEELQKGYSPKIMPQPSVLSDAITQDLSFYVLSDPHLFSKSKPMDPIEKEQQNNRFESSQIIKGYFNKIKQDKDTSIVIFSGDLTQDGDLASTEEFVELLDDLVASGKQVYALPASHDYDSNAIPRKQVIEMYRTRYSSDKIIGDMSPCGYSYVVKLAEGYRMLCLNGDFDDDNGNAGERGFIPATHDWIKEQIKLAREQGDYIFGMMHYPYLEPSPLYGLIAKKGQDIDRKNLEFAAASADLGLEFMFCGHSHVHTVVPHETEAGNTTYAISTASTTAFPTAIRKCTLTKDKLIHESIVLSDDEARAEGIDLGEMSFVDYQRKIFLGLLEFAVYNAAHDIEKLSTRAHSISLKKEDVLNRKFIIKKAGRFLYYTKAKTVARLLLFGGKIDKQTGNKPIKDIVIDIISRAVFHGDAPYTPDTGYYKAVAYLFERISPITKRVKIKKLLDRVVENMYNHGPADWAGELIRQK